MQSLHSITHLQRMQSLTTFVGDKDFCTHTQRLAQKSLHTVFIYNNYTSIHYPNTLLHNLALLSIPSWIGWLWCSDIYKILHHHKKKSTYLMTLVGLSMLGLSLFKAKTIIAYIDCSPHYYDMNKWAVVIMSLMSYLLNSEAQFIVINAIIYCKGDRSNTLYVLKWTYRTADIDYLNKETILLIASSIDSSTVAAICHPT